MVRMNKLFSLRLPLATCKIVINAYDANHTGPMGHSRIDVEVKVDGAVLFPRGELYCAVNSSTAIDSKAAKALVMSLVAMKPGDTDADYFAGYSEAQLAFASAYGEEIQMICTDRYGDM